MQTRAALSTAWRPRVLIASMLAGSMAMTWACAAREAHGQAPPTIARLHVRLFPTPTRIPVLYAVSLLQT